MNHDTGSDPLNQALDKLAAVWDRHKLHMGFSDFALYEVPCDGAEEAEDLRDAAREVLIHSGRLEEEP